MLLTLFSLQAPGIWLLLSLIASALLLLLKQQLTTNWHARLTIGLWIGIPYLGLLLGGLSPRLIGLSAVDWVASLGLGLGLLFIMVLLLMLVRSTMPMPRTNDPSVQTPLATYVSQTLQHGAQEFHWCFYRGAIWELLQMMPNPPALPAYWAVWLAALFALPGALIRPSYAPQRLLLIGIVIATTVLFFYTHNFWLCWLLHTAAWLIVNPQHTPSKPMPALRQSTPLR
ncbi:MAG: hypothetical protein NT075_32890 [Chloroflexi bacterium]|nr:hypothetical protein [Chloroflexota bacterium]